MPKVSLEQVKQLPHSKLLKAIDRVKKRLKKNQVVKDMFKEFKVDLDEIDLIPMCFDDLDVSARTEHGIIYLNYSLLSDGDFDKDDHYIVHELTHYLQQTTGDKPTKGSTDDDYLDNEFEQEGFQNQTEYLSETRSDDAAENYADKVLDHHDVPSDERKERKRKLLNFANILNKNSGLFDTVEEETKKEKQKEKNIIALNNAIKWFMQFGNPRHVRYLDDILDFNPEYSFDPNINISIIFDLPETVILVIYAKINRTNGNCEIENVRVIYSGKNMSEYMQKNINLATEKIIKYHKQTNAWVYDAQIDSKLKPNDPKMISIAKKLGELSKIKTASKSKIPQQLKLNLIEKKEAPSKLNKTKEELMQDFEEALVRGPQESHARPAVEKMHPLLQKDRLRRLKEILEVLNKDASAYFWDESGKNNLESPADRSYVNPLQTKLKFRDLKNKIDVFAKKFNQLSSEEIKKLQRLKLGGGSDITDFFKNLESKDFSYNSLDMPIAIIAKDLDNNNYVGWILVRPQHRPHGTSLEIDTFVDKAYRGEGVGTKLMNMFKEIQTNQYPDAKIEFGPWSPTSSAFYEKTMNFIDEYQRDIDEEEEPPKSEVPPEQQKLPFKDS